MRTYHIVALQIYKTESREIGTSLKADNILEAIENGKKYWQQQLPASFIEIIKAELIN